MFLHIVRFLSIIYFHIYIYIYIYMEVYLLYMHIFTYINIWLYRPIGLMSKVFTNGPGDWGSIPGQVIPKAQKMVLDAALVNTQHYKVRIKGKVEQSREWSSALPYTSVVSVEKGAFDSLLTNIWFSSTYFFIYSFKLCIDFMISCKNWLRKLP